MTRHEPKVKLTVRIFNSTKHLLELIAKILKAKRRGGAPAYGEAIEVVTQYAESQMEREDGSDSVQWSRFVDSLETQEVKQADRRKKNARKARKRKKEAERSLVSK